MRSGAIALLVSGLCLSSATQAACVEESPSYMQLSGDNALDSRTQLVWKRCLLGTSWSANTKRCEGTAKGFSQEEANQALSQLAEGWRLPTGFELETLLVDSCSGLKIDQQVFPNVGDADFGEGAKVWTNTVAFPEMFYLINFTFGDLDMHSSGFGLGVLLVKDA
jgi:hypothetical protein